MTRFLALLMLSAALMTSQADAAPRKAVKSLDPTNGSFHQTHTKSLKMGCNTCHDRATKDTLFLRKDDVVPATMPGQVDRAVCLGCHKVPAKPAWYGLSAR